MGDSDVDTNGGGGGSGGCEKIDRDVEGAKTGVVGKALRWLALNVVLGANKICKRGEELKDRKKGVTDVIV
jgi:hypothetical protein